MKKKPNKLAPPASTGNILRRKRSRESYLTGLNPAGGKNGLKAGFADEAKAKFKLGEKSRFFPAANVGVDETYDKEGNANFKWSPVTWKTSVGVGF